VLDIRPLLLYLLSFTLAYRHQDTTTRQPYTPSFISLVLPLSAYTLSIQSPSPAPLRSPYNTDLRGSIHVYRPPSLVEARHAIIFVSSFPFSCASHFDHFRSAPAFAWTYCPWRFRHPHSFPLHYLISRSLYLSYSVKPRRDEPRMLAHL
jgi:hypothetical protein